MPYGYVRDGREVKKDPVAAQVVSRIFALHRRGESTRKIAARLVRDGIQPPRGMAERWNHTAVAYILSNRGVYCGGQRGASSHRWPVIIGRMATGSVPHILGSASRWTVTDWVRGHCEAP